MAIENIKVKAARIKTEKMKRLLVCMAINGSLTSERPASEVNNPFIAMQNKVIKVINKCILLLYAVKINILMMSIL